MPKLSGEAKITRNGAVLRVLPDVEFDPGGTDFEGHAGPMGTINGHTAKTRLPSLKAKAQMAAGEKMADLTFEDATVVVTLDTGQRFILRGAYGSAKAWKAGKGEVEMEISADNPAEEV